MSCIKVKTVLLNTGAEVTARRVKVPVTTTASVACYVGDGLWAILCARDCLLQAKDGYLMVKNKK